MNGSTLEYTPRFTEAAGYSNYSLYDCNVWGSPSRLALQILVLLMLILNVSAAVVVFGVPVNVRGRHVAFLFICVRVLNLLDLYQCSVVFLFPMGMPSDCKSTDPVYCQISGFCFATATLFSPLVAIVMAIDRCIAIYFHVRYKAKPQTKLKCIVLACLLGAYAFYFTLPFYTNFGSYVPVGWLATCSFEWGVHHRLFNLILALITALLSCLLLCANIAILIKIRQQKREFRKLKSSSQINRKNRNNHSQLRQSKSVDCLDTKGKTAVNSITSSQSLSERRGKRLPPLSIIFNVSRDNSLEREREKKSISTPVSSDTLKGACSPTDSSQNSTCSQRCFSSPSPSEHDNALLVPHGRFVNRLSPEIDTSRPPSPLISTENPDKPSPRMSTKQSSASRNSMLYRLPSSDSLQDVKTSTFGHRINDSNSMRKKALGNVKAGKRSQSADQHLDRRSFFSKSDDEVSSLRHSSGSNSLFSSFIGNRLQSWKSRTATKIPKRRNVSRITKMTTAICSLFVVLYIPFLARKLFQVIPEQYTAFYVPPSVEIVTLFGPLLSPLCNPILYVFLNPHYNENCKRLCRKMKMVMFGAICDKMSSRGQNISAGSNIRFKSDSEFARENGKKSMERVKEFSETDKTRYRAEYSKSCEDVFLSPTSKHEPDNSSISDSSNCAGEKEDSTESLRPPHLRGEDGTRRQSLRQLHLRRLQNLQYRRANSDLLS